MKTAKSLFIAVVSVLLVIGFSADANAQGKGKGNGQGKDKTKKEQAQKKKGPPSWAPAHGYRRRHIYFPEHDMYYDNREGTYISLENGKWTISAEIPVRLAGIDLGKSVQVELEMDDSDSPQSLFDKHKVEFKIK